MSDRLARRYVGWLRRHVFAIAGIYALLLVIALDLVAFHLPLRADFSYLLPQDATAVRDLRKLEARVKASDTVLVIVEAATPNERIAAVRELAGAIRTLPDNLVEEVSTEHQDVREFLETNQDLFASIEDLRTARDALARRIEHAKLLANPLYVPLDDEPARDPQLDRLRDQRRDVHDQLAKLSNVSADGKVAMIEVRTPFRSTDAARGDQLLERLRAIRDRVVAINPRVQIGITGGAVTAVAEHHAISRGMLLSSVITTVLVVLLLAAYFRSARLLGLLIGSLVTATALAFGASVLTVGHLNAATAFLGAIIAGNGVNYGILLIARYLEERRHREVDDAVAIAIAGTLRPTLIAALGASIAYGSLAASSFRGFSDFAVIGGMGMLLVWITSYLLLPALMLRFGRRAQVSSHDPAIGIALARVLGFRRPRAVLAVAAAICLIATVIAVRFVAQDPFEYDIKKLRSKGDEAVAARNWMAVSNKNFGGGLVGRTVIAADRLDQVPAIVDTLHRRDGDRIGEVWSIFRFVPDDQQAKLAVLAQLRDLIDNVPSQDKIRRELDGLRPADSVHEITIANLPPSLRDRFTEKDGLIGTLIEVRPSSQISEWNGRDLIRFASAVREVRLPDGERVTTSGNAVIFADIIASIEHDGPIVTLLAAGGLIVMVGLLVGFNRRAVAVLAGTAAGSLLMVATCAVLDIRVTFLDFVALPITLGLGIDYSINIAHRHYTCPDPIRTLRTSGGAVFVCSLTTIIGYASLLASDNLAIRGFGTASLIGEIACVLGALVLVPAIIAALHPVRGSRRSFRLL